MKTQEETLDELLKARKALIDQMALEQNKGVNRLIAIIREHGRKWDKDHINDETYIQGGFIVVMKKELEEYDFPPEFKAALKYL